CARVHRTHVVAARNGDQTRRWYQLNELRRAARDVVVLADHDQERGLDRDEPLGVGVGPKAGDACGQRLQVVDGPAGGEPVEGLCDRIVRGFAPTQLVLDHADAVDGTSGVDAAKHRDGDSRRETEV